MSRAFATERDDALEPVSIRTWRAQSPAERKRLENRLADRVVQEPPADRSVVAFGATVDVRVDAGSPRRFTIVGADETDVAAGRISAQSPLGSALLGACAGDVVTWHRPLGGAAATVETVAYESVAR
jgi:transcription elongation factor GreB